MSVFPVSTDNRCKLYFDWMTKRKEYWFLWCQQIGMYDIWGYVAVCSSNVFVAMWLRSPDTHCERGLPYGNSREGWPGTAAPYGDLQPQWVTQIQYSLNRLYYSASCERTHRIIYIYIHTTSLENIFPTLYPNRTISVWLRTRQTWRYLKQNSLFYLLCSGIFWSWENIEWI